jgi:filamentous hemagglutinin family protein
MVLGLMREKRMASASLSANRRHGRRLSPVFLAIACCFAFGAEANPYGYKVTTGQASFANSGNTLTITNTPGTIINWQSFSIGANEITRIVQQSASSTILNRVVSSNPSSILGTLQSNGRVFLVNPNGIIFGAGAEVDVAGLVATTLKLSDADFQAGNNNFTQYHHKVSANISNAGNINAKNGGQVYLIAPNVENTGIITAPNGEIFLVAGSSVQLVNSLDPNLAVTITAPAGNATNIGKLVAEAGSLGLFGALVSNTGTASADSATMQGGKIVFRASQSADIGGTVSATGVGGGSISLLADKKNGTVNISGTLDASAPNGGNGGFIETSAAHVKVADTARITTAASKGHVGSWLIDPYDFTIAATGGDITGAALTAALGVGAVTIQTALGSVTCTGATCGLGNAAGNGDIFVNDTVLWSANLLTLNAYRNININAAMTATGTARLALLYGQGAVALNNTSNIITGVAGVVNLPASTTNFTTKQGSNGLTKAYTVITSLGTAVDATTTDLQGMKNGLTLNYVLGANIDACLTGGNCISGVTTAWNAGAGFTPIGNSTTQFTGTFDGLGHTISNLTINLPTASYLGLFGYVGSAGIVRNLGLIGSSVTGFYYLGGLVGELNGGALSNDYATGDVTVVSVPYGTGGPAGGLVGYLYGGAISYSYATGNVTDVQSIPNFATADQMGGLVGFMSSSLGGPFPTITNSYATGNVTSMNNTTYTMGGQQLGGLVGNCASGTISNSYASGNVNGGAILGGLIGYLQGQSGLTATIKNSYATGNVTAVNTYDVTAESAVGGLVGDQYLATTISNSYATGSVSGAQYVGGLVGWIGTGNNSIINNSYATGSVTGWKYVGGLVGEMESGGTVSNSYSAGSVTGVSVPIYGAPQYVGGLVGGVYSFSGTITNSFYNSSTSGQTQGIGGTADAAGTVWGMTTAQMQTQLNFTSATTANGSVNPNWDFTTTPIWGIDATHAINSGYPYLCNVTAACAPVTTAIYLDLVPTLGSSYTSVYGTAPSLSYVYDTSATYILADVISNSLVAPVGTPGNTGAPTSASSVNSYTVTPSIGGITSVSSAYTLSAGNAVTWTVTPAPLMVTANSPTMTYGGTIPALTASYVGFVNSDTSANLSTAPTVVSGTLPSANAGTYTGTITASGAVDSNYTISYTAGNLTIGKAGLTVIANSPTMTYGGTMPALTASYVGFVNSDTSANLSTAPTVVSGTLPSANAGTYTGTITASGAVDSNYTISYTAGNLTIGKAGLTVIANSPTMTYGGTMPTLTASYSGFVNGDSSTNLTTAPAVVSGTAATANAGTYTGTITASGAVDNNYTISYTAGNLTIGKAGLTVIANSPTMTYGGTMPTLTASYSGFVNGDSSTNLTTAPAVVSGTAATANAGTYTGTITASGAVDNNYTISYTAGNLTIGKAGLTVIANSPTMTYGGTMPTLTASYSGFVNGNSSTNLTTAPAVVSGTAATANAGTYTGTITASGAVDNNYTISYTAGNLTIGKAGLTVTGLSGTSRPYNGSTVDALSGTAVLNGTVLGQSLTLGGTTNGTLASPNVGSEAVSTAITIANGTGLASNYKLTQPSLANVTITASVLPPPPTAPDPVPAPVVPVITNPTIAGTMTSIVVTIPNPPRIDIPPATPVVMVDTNGDPLAVRNWDMASAENLPVNLPTLQPMLICQ